MSAFSPIRILLIALAVAVVSRCEQQDPIARLEEDPFRITLAEYHQLGRGFAMHSLAVYTLPPEGPLQLFIYEQTRGRSGASWQAEERFFVFPKNSSLSLDPGGGILPNEERDLEKPMAATHYRLSGSAAAGGRLRAEQSGFDLLWLPLHALDSVDAGLARRRLHGGLAKLRIDQMEQPVLLIVEEIFLPALNPFAPEEGGAFAATKTWLLRLPGGHNLLALQPPKGRLQRLYGDQRIWLLDSDARATPAALLLDPVAAEESGFAPRGFAALATQWRGSMESGRSRCSLRLALADHADLYSLARNRSGAGYFRGDADGLSAAFAVEAISRQWPQND